MCQWHMLRGTGAKAEKVINDEDVVPDEGIVRHEEGRASAVD